MVGTIIKDLESRMEKSLKALEKEYITIRTGRANPAILDNVYVEVYGQQMPINQVATVSCPEPRLIVIQPWDKSNLQSIEKGILKADLSINPANDGNHRRIGHLHLRDLIHQSFFAQIYGCHRCGKNLDRDFQISRWRQAAKRRRRAIPLLWAQVSRRG